MTSRPSKKRALAAVVGEADSATAQQHPSHRLRMTEQLPSVLGALPSMEVESLRAELEHERSLRILDGRRAEQAQARLEQHLKLAVDEAQEAKALLEEVRTQSEAHIQQVREARDDALLQLRDCQTALAEAEEDAAFGEDPSLTHEKQKLLESRVIALTEEVESLRERLREIKEEEQEDEDSDDENKAENFLGGTSSPAPTAVLKELNRVRVLLAESERRHRQLRRKSDEWHDRANQYVQQREAARSATARVNQLETELRELRKEFEAARAVNNSWKDFGSNLRNALMMNSTDPGIDHDAGTELKETTGPPETATVIRYFDKARNRTLQLQQDKNSLQRQLETFQKRVTSLERQVKDASAAEASLQDIQKELEGRLDRTGRELQTMQAQERIWKREADSLRTLLKTYDDMAPAAMVKREGAGSAAGTQATIKALELSLSSARDQERVLTEARESLTKEMESCQTERKKLQTDHNRVVEKFGRLRDALRSERAKAEEAEERACKAEALAGKGSFNAEETRVLHLQQNPLTDALKGRYQSEIASLRKQLEDATGDKLATGSGAVSSEVDPQKLHQRLKESFKEQIGLFREGVYLMTGYKVDMLPNTDRPTFRVRSMYAEQEHDHLLFVWPESDDEATSLDLVETEQAKLLSTTDSYEYMTKFNSLPAFLASVQLTLFEKQTLAG